MSVATDPTLAQLVAGTWTIDPTHSEVSFVARHLMVSKVKGSFKTFHGTVTIADDPFQSSVEATIETASVDTRDSSRDEHLRSAQFLDVENYPEMTYRSREVVT
ncbi:MAG: YceI family protein, partial [Acidimicrobiales bacterium]